MLSNVPGPPAPSERARMSLEEEAAERMAKALEEQYEHYKEMEMDAQRKIRENGKLRPASWGEALAKVGEATKGKAVENWMNELEDEMCEALRKAMEVSIQQYPQTDRNQWVLEHPGQCVLNGSQVHWTDEVEEAIEGRVDSGLIQG